MTHSLTNLLYWAYWVCNIFLLVLGCNLLPYILIYIYIYIYNVINPKISIPHPHLISAYIARLSSLFSLVSLTNHNLTHSQSHLQPTTQPLTANPSLRHHPKLCQCHRSPSSDLTDKHLKRSSASPHRPHLAGPSSTS